MVRTCTACGGRGTLAQEMTCDQCQGTGDADFKAQERIPDLEEDPSDSKKCAAWFSWFASHPYGQLVALFCITIPFGAAALAVSASSFEKINDAVGDFERILNNWRRPTITAVSMLPRDSQCPAGSSIRVVNEILNLFFGQGTTSCPPNCGPVPIQVPEI